MKSEVQLLPTLPNDMIEEILLKLPVKSVLRFKCVWKSWQSIILNPQFAKSHFDRAAEPTHRVLNVVNNCEIKSIDTDVAFDDDPKEVMFHIPLPSHDFKVIAGSCRGFILLKPSTFFTTFIDFLIWNPSTGSVKHIMPIENNSDTPLCGIGYDSSTDDYLVVVVIGLQRWTKVKYFSLRTNSWSFSKCTRPYDIIYLRHGEFLNGALHWLVKYSYDHHYVIIAFNMRRKRRLLEIPVPQHLASAILCKIYNLRVMNECLCICVKNDTMLEIWMMKEYKVQSSWTKSFVLCCLWRPSGFIYPICFTKHGDILVTDGFGQTLSRFNDKGVLLQYCRHRQLMNKSTFHLKYSCMCRESLLSLPGECKDEQLHFVTIGMQRAKRRM